MNKLKLLLLPAILFIASCTSNTEEKVVEEHEEHVIENNVTEAWQGNLNGNIPVLLWYKKFDNVLRGSLFYTNQKNAKPIRVIGTIYEENYSLLEFMPDGSITGIWTISPQPSSAEGQWFSPNSRKKLNCSLLHIDTAAAIENISLPNSVSGNYIYKYGKDGATGSMDVVQLDSNTIVINISAVTDGPAYNLADIEQDTLTLNKNVAIHKSSEYGLCEFKLSFYSDFANIEYQNNSYDCGFGHNARVSGIYLKQQ